MISTYRFSVSAKKTTRSGVIKPIPFSKQYNNFRKINYSLRCAKAYPWFVICFTRDSNEATKRILIVGDTVGIKWI